MTEEREDLAAGEAVTGLWGKLLRYSLAYPRVVAGLVGFGTGMAVGEIVLTLLTRKIVDRIAEPGAGMLGLALVYGAILVAMCGCVLGFIRSTGRLKTHVAHDLRRDGFENLQRLSFSFYDRRSVGWLMARMTSDCERLAVIMTWGLLEMVWGSTMILGISAVCLWLDWRLAVAMLAVVPALALCSVWFQRRLLGVSREVRRTNSLLTAAYAEGLSGVATTKTFAREEADLADFSGLSGRMLAASLQNALLTAAYLPTVMLLGSVAVALALRSGGIAVLEGRVSLGTLVAFLTFARYLLDPIRDLANLFAQLQTARASGERIVGLIEEVPAVRDSAEVVERARTEAAAWEAERIETISFRDVSFAYTPENPVLADFDLDVRAGETVAIVGPTGGGKTTITALLCRFYEPTGGRILFDGRDARERSLEWLHARLGIVLQEPHLFRGTIAENIRYGRLDATDDEVREAARTVGAHEFIEGLERGYDTDVGEAGGQLSTGQKQLVSFARALLRDPEILVMDEATSSIDTETELRIQRALSRVLAGRTCFVIAHRLSTIRDADRILFVERGRIVEQGRHAELLRRGGRYAALHRRSAGAAHGEDGDRVLPGALGAPGEG